MSNLNAGWFSLGAHVISDLPEAVDRLLRSHLGDAGAGIQPDGRAFRITVGRVTASREGQQVQFPGSAMHDWHIHYREKAFWIPGVFRAEIDERHVEFRVEQACLENTGDHLELFSLAFAEAHRAGGWLPLHAATVARGSRAVAISGVSGAGKSTAVLRLWNHGFRVVAEDRTFWHAESGQVAGLDRCLRVFDDSIGHFPPVSLTGIVGRDAKGKGLLPLQRSDGAASLDRLFLFAPREAITLAQKVRAVWEMTGVPLTSLAREQAQRNVTRLIPLVHSVGITRESVMDDVSFALTGAGAGDLVTVPGHAYREAGDSNAGKA